jgi:hypothetical protein
MNLLDFELQDLPVEFKQINPEDFDSQHYEVEPKNIITPNDEGYISNQIIELIGQSYDEKNTVVINAGVGQGKSYAVIEMIKNYVNTGEYVVILAVPYNSLIQQYEDDLSKDTNENSISRNEIFNMLDIKHLNFPESLESKQLMNYGFISDDDVVKPFKVSDYKVHIMSINSLLGNSGEDFLFQAGKKIKYFSNLHTYCAKNNKKVIVFFDEIHDGIHNFKEEYFYSFWKYQGFIHKIFVVSATFNEASKEVIKYLSEFTERKIQIVESERIIFPEKQSRLHLVIHNSGALSSNNGFLKILNDIVDAKTDFDIVVYSKEQIKMIFQKDATVKGILMKAEKRINYCYADVFDRDNANNKYDNNYYNVGTNFTTGVNINKENHALIIFIPYRLDIDFVNNKGVFTSGANAIIQTLARQRKVGDIYMIMPPPLGINLKSLPYTESINESIVNTFNSHKEYESKIVEYSNINEQSKLLDKTYRVLKRQVNNAEVNILNVDRIGMNRLLYPTKEIFILEKGEKYLTSQFFGGDLATYVFWASITNQFQNCKLTSIVKKYEIFFEKENLYSYLVKSYQDTLSNSVFQDEEGLNLNHFSKYKLYFELEQSIIRNKLVYIDGKSATKKQFDRIRLFLLNIINFEEFTPSDEKEIKAKLYKYYLQSCVKYSIELDINRDYTIDLEMGTYQMERELGVTIFLFKEWSIFIELIRNSIINVRARGNLPGKIALNIKPSETFVSLFNERQMKNKLNELRLHDKFLKTDIFSYNDTLGRITEDEKTINFFYSLLVDILFQKDSKNIKVGQIRYYNIQQILNLNELNLNNLLYDNMPEVVL